MLTCITLTNPCETRAISTCEHIMLDMCQHNMLVKITKNIAIIYLLRYVGQVNIRAVGVKFKNEARPH